MTITRDDVRRAGSGEYLLASGDGGGDLPAPGSSLRRTGPRRHQAVQAKAYGENDSATPEPRLLDRNTESSTQPSTNAVIFEPD
jgi:hypothetical protein